MKAMPSKLDIRSASGGKLLEELARKLKLGKGLGFLVCLPDTRVDVLYQQRTAQNDITPRRFS
jgi:hypothetical protein